MAKEKEERDYSQWSEEEEAQGFAWRKVGGISIKFTSKDEDVATAMSKSGKFTNKQIAEAKKKFDDAKVKKDSTKEVVKKNDPKDEDSSKKEEIEEEPTRMTQEDWELARPNETKMYEAIDNGELNEKDVQEMALKYNSTDTILDNMRTLDYDMDKYTDGDSIWSNDSDLTDEDYDAIGKEVLAGMSDDDIKDMLISNGYDNLFTEDEEISFNEIDLEDALKEQNVRQEETLTKPMENSYSGHGWKGVNFDSKLETKDIAKNVLKTMKEKYPDVKIGRKTDYDSITLKIDDSDGQLIRTREEIGNLSSSEQLELIKKSYGGIGKFDMWMDNNNKKSADGTYTDKEIEEYIKNSLYDEYVSDYGIAGSVREDNVFLNDKGKEVVRDLKRELNSYNYDDDDPMTDYFNSNFFDSIYITRKGKK